MILRKDRRKRKHDLDDNKKEETDDTNAKYVAYIRKTSSKNNKSKNEVQPSCTVSSSSIENLSEKKTKKKKKIKVDVMDVNTEISEPTTVSKKNHVMICAKPVINKNAVKLNSAISTDCKGIKYLSKGKKIIPNLKMSKHLKQASQSEYITDIEVITPQVSLASDSARDDLFKPSKSSKSQFQSVLTDSSSLFIDNPSTESLPIIVEANLKKSSNSYIPKALQNHKEVTKGHDIVNKLPKTDKNMEKKSESVSSMDRLVDGSNDLVNTQQSNCDIPKALQEFYNEVTQAFECTVNKSPKSDKNNKKKTTLSADKSVKDPNNLVDIVHKNTALLDNFPLTNQENVAQLFSLESKVILVLLPETQFSFLGKLKLKVLYGAVELYGSVFDPRNTVKPVELYSPRGYSSISISTFNLDGVNDKEALWDALTSEGVDRSLKTKLHDAIKECKCGWSVLLLENFDNTLTNFLNSHCSFKLFPKVENIKYSWCDPRRAECVLQANFQFYNSRNEISISPQWNESITRQLLVQWNSTKSLSIMIAGGKGVGKSTTARYLINNLLRHSKKVVLLDLDPGQAEMTPSACVSLNILDEPLLGPNFTHLKTPFYQLYLEDINVSNCITRYIECIKKLVECFKSRKDLAEYPIIVNTMGFCKGIGLDICVYLLKLIEPTNVIQIISKRPKNNFDFALLKKNINGRKTSSISWDDDKVFEKSCDYDLHYVSSMAEGKRQFDTWNMEPRQQREVVLLSYLSQIIENADEKRLSFSSLYVSLTKSSISPTHILAAMNGNIVALCGIDFDNDADDAKSSRVDKECLSYPLVVIKPPPCTCYGYGIVRGIDMKLGCVYVSTPLSESLLRHVNLLAGCSAMPFSLLQPAPADRSALVAGTGPYAADRAELPTSRKPRRGYFRVNHNRAA